MAVSETARLIAALELQDKFSKPVGNADRALGGFERRLGSVNRTASTMGRGVGTALSNIAKVGVGAAVVGAGLLAVNIKKGVDSLHELESVTVATNTVLKSTKGVSGQTADGIRALSEEYENLNATMDDKVIQSGANMLLTFTNIRTKAFEPALEAALNLNEAMGGGEEGLQRTIIQVGKALNDPIRGVTALRRVGVQLSKQQEDQIKTLVEQNDLYGAQRIILDELTTQFGGRFAAAGKTGEGRMAALRDRIEDVQKALAGPLIPAIDRVREKLISFLGTDRVLSGAERLGQAIAGLFSERNLDRGVSLLEQGMDALTRGDLKGVTANLGSIASAIGGLPWQSIGDAARLLGTGSKALLDAFLGLPGWVQTAVLTGWGLNKLTGGALGGVAGSLTSMLGKWVTQKLGLMTVQAGVVNVNGPAGATGGKGPGGKVPLVAGLATLPLALSGSESGLDKITQQQKQLTDLFDRKLLDKATFQRLWQQAYAGQNISAQLNDIRGINQSMRSDSERLAGIASGLGPRIDRVANTPHNVNVNNHIDVGVSVSVVEQMVYRRRTMLNRSSISTNTAGF